MKRIICGKVYDTCTAKELASWESSPDATGFDYISETIYQKRTGEFFIFGFGGPDTKYAVSAGQHRWSSGSQIIPLTWDSAREWAENHLSAEEYEKIFGSVTDDESRITVTLSLSASAVKTAKRKAAQAGMSFSGLIESLLV